MEGVKLEDNQTFGKLFKKQVSIWLTSTLVRGIILIITAVCGGILGFIGNEYSRFVSIDTRVSALENDHNGINKKFEDFILEFREFRNIVINKL